MKNSQKGYKFTACGIPIRRIDSSLVAQRKAILAGNAESISSGIESILPACMFAMI